MSQAAAHRFDVKKRRAARMAAAQTLYELDMVGGDVDPVLRTYLDKRWSVIALEDEDGDEVGEAELLEPDQTFLIDVVRGVTARKPEIDDMLDKALGEKWDLGRLEVLMRSILRAGAYELLARSDVPAKVVINEYMDVANAFFTEGEPKMVNGVLDRLAHILRDGAMD
ncbi:MAG: transcription antitermination factor NusB [Alphaproteobacteria bacterium]|nr:transcription antitermination factor NusB [Alphaproteobacteria bacterium]MBF0249054.1 transcription antitermination factor NusB [Alphaproteobacteria bacterium]